MTLQKQIVPIEIGALNQKADPKKVPVGQLTRLENAELNKAGRIDKRPGFDTLATKIDPRRLMTRGKDLVLLDLYDNKLFQYESAGNHWLDRKEYFACRIKTKDVAGNAQSAYTVSSAYANGYTLSCFAVSSLTQGTSDIVVSVKRESDGTEVVEPLRYSVALTDKTYVQAVALGTKIFIVYNSQTNIIARYFDTTNPHLGLSTTTTVASDRSQTDYPMKVIAFSSTEMVVGYYDGTNTKLRFFNESYTTSTILTTSGRGVYALGIDANGVLYAVYGEASGNGIRAWVVSTAKATVTTSVVSTDPNITTASVVRQPKYNYNPPTGAVILYHDEVAFPTFADPAPNQHRINFRRIESNGTLSTEELLCYGCRLWSDAFERDDKLWVTTLLASATQPTYYLMKIDMFEGWQDMRIAGVFLPQEGADNEIKIPTAVSVISSTKYKIPLLRSVKVRDSFLIEAPAEASVEFMPTTACQHVTLDNRTFVSGGFLGVYDGTGVIEAGFFHYPEFLYLYRQTTAGSNLEAKTYGYIALFEWYDANGLLHRSEPSAPISVVGVVNKANEIAVGFLNVSNINYYSDFRYPAKLVLYRTEGNGTTYYRHSEKLANASLVSYHVFTDDTADDDILDNEILYTTGGVLASQCPPACGNVQVWKNRVWLSDCEKENQIFYSKIKEQSVEFEFNLSNLVQVDEFGTDDCLATFPIDDKLLIFKDKRLLYLYGDGPNNAGGDASYPQPIEINHPTGLRDPLSLARIPGGCVFKSDKGFYAIGADLNPVDIGKPVEDLNSAICTSALAVPGKDQVRFTHSDGPILVYDYHFQSWYYHSLHEVISAVIWQDTYTLVTTDEYIYRENASIYKDTFFAYNFLLQTGWISLASLIGLQRVYKLFVEAAYKSFHSLLVTIDLEQNGTVYTETHTVVADTVTANNNETYRFAISLRRQKCSSIRIKIEDTLTDLAVGTHQALSILALGLEVGLKRGGPKYKLTHKVG